jgi:hypothetical protein
LRHVRLVSFPSTKKFAPCFDEMMLGAPAVIVKTGHLALVLAIM